MDFENIGRVTVIHRKQLNQMVKQLTNYRINGAIGALLQSLDL